VGRIEANRANANCRDMSIPRRALALQEIRSLRSSGAVERKLPPPSYFMIKLNNFKTIVPFVPCLV
jgi:hypothetical protein